jgi:hypothetical protein
MVNLLRAQIGFLCTRMLLSGAKPHLTDDHFVLGEVVAISAPTVYKW